MRDPPAGRRPAPVASLSPYSGQIVLRWSREPTNHKRKTPSAPALPALTGSSSATLPTGRPTETSTNHGSSSADDLPTPPPPSPSPRPAPPAPAPALAPVRPTISPQDPRPLLLKPGLPVTRLDFGHLLRDGTTFSSEYSTDLTGTIEQQADTLSIRGEGFSPWKLVRTIVTFDSIASNVAASESSVLLELAYAPSFQEVDPQHKSPPVRITAFDADLQEIAPFSRHLLLTFYYPRDVVKFFRAITALPLPRPIITPRISLNPNLHLFDPPKIEALKAVFARLPITAAFQLAGALYDGTLLPDEIHEIAPAVDTLQVKCGERTTERILEELRGRLRRDLRERRYHATTGTDNLDPFSVATLLDGARRFVLRELEKLPLADGGAHFLCRHAVVSPMRITLEGPFIEEGSSIVRRYPEGVDSLLRVSFVDEDGSPLRVGRTGVGRKFLEQQILAPLLEGIGLAGRNYVFLGYSQAAMKNRSVVMVTPFLSPQGQQVTAESIRESSGDFDMIRDRPSLYGARLSQNLTSSRASVVLKAHEIIRISDLVGDDPTSPGAIFTDGCGSISLKLRDRIWDELLDSGYRRDRDQPPPSAFQVRIGGSKGVVIVDATLSGTALILRHSQEKFKTDADTPEGWTLNIAKAFTRPGLLALNRPLVSALDDLQVPDVFFLDLLAEARHELSESKHSYRTAASLLSRYECGGPKRLSSLFAHLSTDPYLALDSPLLTQEPFLRTVMEVVTSRVLMDFKTSARIPLPQSWQLVGVPDLDSYLKPNEVYACIRRSNESLLYLEGTIAVTRSPTVGPADVRIVRAVGRVDAAKAPRMQHLFNVVILPTRGPRSLASQMGGGDTDGDEFQLIVDPQFVPDLQRQVEPASHVALAHRKIPHRAEIQDVAEALVSFIEGDTVGMIATQHLREADFNPEGGLSKICLKLADLHSQAVDFAKTGSPVPLESIPRASTDERPDFMRGHRRDMRHSYYESQRVLGKLYRAIPDIDTEPPSERDVDRESPSSADSTSAAFTTLRETLELRIRTLLSLPLSWVLAIDDELIDVASRLFGSFTSQALHLAAVANFPRSVESILSEPELFATTIHHSGTERDKKQRRTAIQVLQLQVERLVDSIEDVAASRRPLREKVLILWAFWGEARGADQAAFGTRSARWLAVAMLLEAVAEVEQKGAEWVSGEKTSEEDAVDELDGHEKPGVDEGSWGVEPPASRAEDGW